VIPLAINPRRLSKLSFIPLVAATVALSGCNLSNARDVDGQGADRPSLLAARAALDSGSAESALGIAKGILVSEPHNPAALTAQGDALAALGNRRDAEISYRHALQNDPHNVGARLGLGKLVLRTDTPSAEKIFRALLAEQPQDSRVMTDLGVALDLEGHHTEAQALYRQALVITPELNSAHTNLGLSLALSGHADQAMEMLHDAAMSSPDSTRVRANYAMAQVLAGHSDDAMITLRSDMSEADARASVAGMEGFNAPK